jgi:HD-GYP domain-containing protein (c-di-GMP phosphodiesterase class II)
MDKIVEALKNLLPENEVNEVANAVGEILEQAKEKLEAEYNQKLEEAYAELTGELAEAEKIAEQGYEEAYAIIGDLRNRLEVQGQEYKDALEEGYEEAYQMLKSERAKNENLEVEMYEEYDQKLAEMKEYIVDKVDQFLQLKGHEIYEQARRDVLSDPRLAEHKVALDKIVNIATGYMSDEEFGGVNNEKIEEASREIEALKGQMRILEARNIRISTENTKLNEAVRQAQDLITESRKVVSKEKKAAVLTEQNERALKAKNVSGRGNLSSDNVVISEHNNASAGNSDMDQLLILSGLKQTK